MTKQKPKLSGTVKHHRDVLRAIREIVACETWKTVKGDAKLAEEIQSMGVYASSNIVRDVRMENKIPTAYERKMAHFAKSKGTK